MSDKYVLDAEGNPVPCDDLLTWGAWFERNDRVLCRDEFENVNVSTVFLGLDHNFGNDGPPVLWETMIFGGEHDQYQDRYTSREAALEGHGKAVAMVWESLKRNQTNG